MEKRAAFTRLTSPGARFGNVRKASILNSTLPFLSTFVAQHVARAMLPTPSTSHVDFDKIYEPSEDSYLLLDTLSSPTESEFLTERFGGTQHAASVTPLILEVGTGSGVVLAFVTAHAKTIFGRKDVFSIGTDVNNFACQATRRTVQKACEDVNTEPTLPDTGPRELSVLSETVMADLTSPLRSSLVDVLIFNPPYVPTPDVSPLATDENIVLQDNGFNGVDLFTRDSHLLSLSYSGGMDGMEVTNRLLDQLPIVLSQTRGLAYIILCQQNKPKEVMERVRNWGSDWSAEVVGSLGRQGGWEKLCIMRVARVVKTRA